MIKIRRFYIESDDVAPVINCLIWEGEGGRDASGAMRRGMASSASRRLRRRCCLISPLLNLRRAHCCRRRRNSSPRSNIGPPNSSPNSLRNTFLMNYCPAEMKMGSDAAAITTRSLSISRERAPAAIRQTPGPSSRRSKTSPLVRD